MRQVRPGVWLDETVPSKFDLETEIRGLLSKHFGGSTEPLRRGTYKARFTPCAKEIVALLQARGYIPADGQANG